MTTEQTAQDLPEISQVERLALAPGEVLVVHVNTTDLPNNAADRIRVIVESKLPKGSRVLVVPKGTEFSVVSPTGPGDREPLLGINPGGDKPADVGPSVTDLGGPAA